ncbi:MAG: pepA [Pseudonocardiales bacterium]|nr:pepA [Pseudonocardiales bacterium]
MFDVRLAAGPPATEVRETDTSGDPTVLRRAAGRLARDLPDGPAAIGCRGLRGERLAAFVEGLVLGAYRFSLVSRPHPGAGPVQLVGVDDALAVERGLRAARATVWARDLANTPAATKTPRWLATQARRQLGDLGVEIVERDQRWLAANGFGGVLAVGCGSTAPPRLIEASWRPRGARSGVHVVLVGKGITFDTGGINVKRGDGMRTMHTDMSGGAAVLAALRAIAGARVPVRVTALVPAAENAFAGASFRPGDVVRHYGGRTSEITNTDAEGRIVLADALAYAAARKRPTVLVDLATLTGAMKIALGLRVGGLFATTDSLAADLVRAGDAAGEPLWRMPLAADYDSTLRSDIADAHNSPGNPGGITAALFLKPFTGGLPWAHLDIAGPARALEDDGMLSRGGTGFGARLLARYVESLAR